MHIIKEKSIMIKELKKLTEVEHHAPVVDREKSQTYLTLLEEAIDNKDIYNIALSGPYGSGKSTIIKTLMSRVTCGGNKYLEISLASFDQKEDKSLGYLIEKSILQQFFYKVSKASIPYSRLTRIMSYGFMKIASIVAVIFIWIFSYYFVNNIDRFKQIFTLAGAETSLYFTFTLVSLILLWQIVKRLSSVRLSKLIVQNAEIEWDGGESSLLNKYLDEILYFFEETKYSVVIIEDLDRYGKTDIFEKLRELNILINSYEKIKHKVTFIYAVKDSLFAGSDRTKFFDYIVPVIPVINMSNAKDKLQEKIASIGYEDLLSQDLLKEVSFHIADYRRLLNIFSEFKVYILELKLENGSKKEIEKLFCMIVYKNFFPNDFESLHSREGMLYNVFHDQKTLLIDILQNKIKEQVIKLEESIQDSEDEYLINEDELRVVFVAQAFSIHPNVATINLDGQLRSASDIAKNTSLFDAFRKINTIRCHNVSGGNLGNYTFDFFSLNANGTYEDRIKLIENKKKSAINMMKQNLLQLKREQRNIRHSSLAELMILDREQEIKKEVLQFNPSKDELKNNIELIRAWDLVKYFIRNEYITEDYSNFTSYFYDILISMSDFSYINSIRNDEASDYHREIDNPKSLLDNIAPAYFKYESVLNVKLIEYLLINKNNYSEHYRLLVEQLTDQSAKNNDFIIAYLVSCNNKGISLFIQAYCEQRDDFWKRVVHEWKFDYEPADVILKSMITSLDINVIEKMDLDGELSKYLANKRDFLLYTSEIDDEEFHNLVTTLDLKFNKLNRPTLDIETVRLEYLLNNYQYKINSHMLNLMIASFSKTADSLSYSSIKGSTLSSLIRYVDKNLSHYIREVWLQTETPIHEEEKYYLELLNNDSIDEKQKFSIVEHADTHIMDLSKLEPVLWEEHMLAKRVEPIWLNVLRYFYELAGGEVDETLTDYLNDEVVYSMLATESYIVDEEDFDADQTNTFFAAITKSEDITEDALEYYYKSFETCWNNLDISNLTPERALFLVEVGFLCVQAGNYTNLKSISSNANLAPHIRLLEKDFSKVLLKFDEYDVDCVDIKNILESNNIDEKLKLSFIEEKIDTLLDCEKEDFVDLIVDLTLKSTYSSYSPQLAKYVLDSELIVQKKMKLLASTLKYFSHEDVTEMLNLLGGVFCDIARNSGLRPKITLTGGVLDLIEALENVKYIYSKTTKDTYVRVITKNL